MAIENEFKFILRDSDKLMEYLRPVCKARKKFHQVYISDNARFRRVSSEQFDDGIWIEDVYFDIYFTYKQMIDGQLLEMEMEYAEQADFDLALKAEVGGLKKYRYTVVERSVVMAPPDTSARLRWEIDFLLDSNDVPYFALAEIEVPVGTVSVEPPSWLEPYVELSVPQHHNFYFTNFRLSNSEYAKKAVSLYLADLEAASSAQP